MKAENANRGEQPVRPLWLALFTRLAEQPIWHRESVQVRFAEQSVWEGVED